MDSHLSSDKPIQQQVEDKFQRYNFSKRIADTIRERKNNECIVIGLYGAWGEGKTSVLNFIDFELSKDPNVVIIKFNPWRFKDEEALLRDFFNTLALSLNKSLKTNGDKVKDLLKKYTSLSSPFLKLIPFYGDTASGAVEKIGDLFSDETLEDLKSKIDEILRENANRIVVFIDDIDRLNKDEIHSIFRLVKLTADFYNTTYILSFDEDMVASAIGERFGEGNKQSGKNFLEKIVQVPLNLPLAQAAALQKFCFDAINQVFETSGIVLNEEEGRRFAREFQNNILLRLDTPRLAVRYANALSFAIPLLIGEVDVDDLLLIEAIKIFYPDHYDFIKQNPNYFISSYSQNNIFEKRDEKIAQFNSHLDKLGNQLTLKQKEAVRSLLIELFPQLKEAFQNQVYVGYFENRDFKNKRICSSKHFNRFFSYAVIEGDLSDVAFKRFIERVPEHTVEAVAIDICNLIKESSIDTVLLKLRSLEEDYSWSVAKSIVTAIVSIPDQFPKYENRLLMRFENPYGQSQIFIYQILKKHSSKEDKIELVKELLEKAQTFEYAYDLTDWFRSTNSNNLDVFSESELEIFDLKLIQRAIREAGNKSIFEMFQGNIVHLINEWKKIDNDALQKYTLEQLEKNPNEAVNILRICTPTMSSSYHPQPYKSDLAREYYNKLVSVFDKEFLTDWIQKVFSQEQISEKEVEWFYREKGNQTDLNIARQFFHWRQEDKKMEN